MNKIKKIISLFLVITNIFLNIRITNLNALEEKHDFSINDIESVVIENNLLLVTMKNSDDYQYALVSDEDETPIYQNESEFEVAENKNYILYVKNAHNEQIEANIDTIAPVHSNLNLKYSEYDNETRMYNKAEVSFNISKDTCMYRVFNSSEEKIDEKNINSDNLNVILNFRSNGKYEIMLIDEFNNMSSFNVEVLGIQEKLPQIKTNITSDKVVVKDNKTWAKSFNVEINFDDELEENTFLIEDYYYSLVKDGEENCFQSDNNFNVYQNATYLCQIESKESGIILFEPLNIEIDSIDSTAPEFEEKAYEFDEDKGFLTIFASDEGVGIEKYVSSYHNDKNQVKELESKDGKFKLIDIPDKELTVEVFDQLGNSSEIMIDREKPIISNVNLMYYNIVTNSNEESYGKRAKVEIEASDQQSEKLSYACSGTDDINNIKFNNNNTFYFDEEGIYYFYAKDEVGNISEAKKLKINIDNEAPIINNYEIINMFAENSKYSNQKKGFMIKVEASDDGVGIAEYGFAIYQKGHEPVFEKGKNNGSFEKTVLENGTYYIEVKDMLGNTVKSEAIEITGIDNLAPIVEEAVLTAENGQLYFDELGTYANSNIIVTIPIKDNKDQPSAVSGLKESPILKIKFVENNQETILEYQGKKVGNSDNYIFEIDKKNTNFTMALIAVDNVENTTYIENLEYKCNGEQLNVPILIDDKSPGLEVFVDNSNIIEFDNKIWFCKDLDISYSVNDLIENSDSSGIKELIIKVNGRDYINNAYLDKNVYNIDNILNTSDLSAYYNKDSGKLVIEIIVIDKAGNQAEKSLTLYRDFRAPEVEKVTIKKAGEKGKLFFFEANKFYCADDYVDIVVKLNDTYEYNSSSGINAEKTVLNIVDSTGTILQKIKAYDVGDNKETYTFRIELTNKFFSAYIQTEDNLGQKITTEELGKKIIEANERGFENIIIDNQNPVISPIKVEGTVKTINQKEWLNQNTTISYTISDISNGQDSSGLSTVDVEVNGKIISELCYDLSKKKRDKFAATFNTDFLQSEEDGKIAVKIIVKDNAGNISQIERVIYRDLDAPVLETKYDNYNADNTFTDFYKENRVLTLNVKEINFDADLMDVIVSKNGNLERLKLQWQLVSGNEDTINAVYQTKIIFNEDADYEVYISGKDMMGFDLNKPFTNKFVLDKTKPVLNISYDNYSAKNNNYFNQSRTATITIDEHNFDPSRVNIISSAIDDGVTKAFPKISSWTRNNDKNIATIKYDQDALYSFDIEYIDKAGNKMDDYNKDEFYIDKTAPELIISGVEANSANSGEVKPAVLGKDTNYDINELNISLIGDHRGTMEIGGTRTPQTNGEIFVFDDMLHEKENDDVYMIQASLSDKAGNKSETNIMYSVNRFGSTYVFSDKLLKILNQHYHKNSQEIVFDELNVNRLIETSVKISINGQIKELKKDVDYALVQTNEGAWYRYTYALKSELFEKDGAYRIITSSVDEAGNLNENIIENKNADISFIIDKTAPTIAVHNLKSNNIYDETVKKVELSVEDNLMIDKIEVLLNDKNINVDEVNENNFIVSIPEKNRTQNLKIVVLDKAGNKSTKEINNFTISSNFFVRWYLNKPLFISSLAILALLIAMIIFVYLKRNKKE